MLGFVAAATAGAKLSQPQRTPPGEMVVLALPSEWIPFRADVINFHPASTSAGTFHRRRDGSAAWIIEGSGRQAITIHNLQTKRTYVKFGENGWKAYVMPSGAGTRQQELRFLRSEVQIVSEPSLGDLYEHWNARTGQLTRFAPSLNGFIVKLRRSDGSGQEFRNNVIVDKPENLYMPPSDAELKETGRPIVGR
jgi:hypothetical protein